MDDCDAGWGLMRDSRWRASLIKQTGDCKIQFSHGNRCQFVVSSSNPNGYRIFGTCNISIVMEIVFPNPIKYWENWRTVGYYFDFVKWIKSPDMSNTEPIDTAIGRIWYLVELAIITGCYNKWSTIINTNYVKWTTKKTFISLIQLFGLKLRASN